MLIIKYKTLKRIHKNFLNIANVKIKASNTDKAIFTAQCILAVTTIICLLIS